MMNDDFLSQFRKPPRRDFADSLYQKISQIESLQEEEEMSMAQVLPFDGSKRRILRERQRRHYWTFAVTAAAFALMIGLVIITNRPSSNSMQIVGLSSPGQNDPLPTATADDQYDTAVVKVIEELGAAESATIRLNLPPISSFLPSPVLAGNFRIQALEPTSPNLFEADLETNVIFDVIGERTRSIEFGGESVSINRASTLRTIGLSPNVPINLIFGTTNADVEADLSDLQLTSLQVHIYGGSVNIDLPQGETLNGESFSISPGSGTINVPDDTTFNLQSLNMNLGGGDFTVNIGRSATFNLGHLLTYMGHVIVNVSGMEANFTVQRVVVYTGMTSFYIDEGVSGQVNAELISGTLSFDVPESLGVRVYLDQFSENNRINLPEGYIQTQDDRANGNAVQVWESPNFATAETQLRISVPIFGGGTLTVR